jgi:hypothetical protein
LFQIGPNNRHQLVEIYAKISQLPDGDHGSLPFVLLSKLDLDRWLLTGEEETATHTGTHNSNIHQLTELIIAALRKSGPEPPPARQLIHGLHRRHLVRLVQHAWPARYAAILTALLGLAANNQVDPELWYDLLNAMLRQPGAVSANQLQSLGDSSSKSAVSSLLESYARSHAADAAILGVVDLVAEHFARERRQFGLYGLYPKYRAYVRPLAVYLHLLNLQVGILPNAFYLNLSLR